MFALTRDGARVAPDAGLTVKEKPETSHPFPRTIKIVLTPPNVLRLVRNRLLMKRVSDTTQDCHRPLVRGCTHEQA